MGDQVMVARGSLVLWLCSRERSN